MDVIFPEMRYSGMETTIQIRLKSAMDARELNALELAKRAGVTGGYVQDILKGRSKNPTATKLQPVADVLGTTVQWLLGQSDEMLPKASHASEIRGMNVLGKIQAGNWVDRSLIDETYEIEVIPVARDTRFPNAKQYAMEVVGDSMDLKYPEGSYVTCVDYWDSGLTLKEGHTVHVERHNGPLVEMTLKSVEWVDGATMLCPKSSNPRHKPIPLEGDGGTEIVIKGIVLGSYRPETV